MSTITPTPPSDAIPLETIAASIPNTPFYPACAPKDASNWRFFATYAMREQAQADYIFEQLAQAEAVSHPDSSVFADALTTSYRYLKSDVAICVENLVTEGGLLFFHTGITSDAQLAQIDDYAEIAAQHKREQRVATTLWTAQGVAA